jgi:prefoldin subunit 5
MTHLWRIPARLLSQHEEIERLQSRIAELERQRDALQAKLDKLQPGARRYRLKDEREGKRK